MLGMSACTNSHRSMLSTYSRLLRLIARTRSSIIGHERMICGWSEMSHPTALNTILLCNQLKLSLYTAPVIKSFLIARAHRAPDELAPARNLRVELAPGLARSAPEIRAPARTSNASSSRQQCARITPYAEPLARRSKRWSRSFAFPPSLSRPQSPPSTC